MAPREPMCFWKVPGAAVTVGQCGANLHMPIPGERVQVDNCTCKPWTPHVRTLRASSGPSTSGARPYPEELRGMSTLQNENCIHKSQSPGQLAPACTTGLELAGKYSGLGWSCTLRPTPALGLGTEGPALRCSFPAPELEQEAGHPGSESLLPWAYFCTLDISSGSPEVRGTRCWAQ